MLSLSGITLLAANQVAKNVAGTLVDPRPGSLQVANHKPPIGADCWLLVPDDSPNSMIWSSGPPPTMQVHSSTSTPN